MGSEAAAGPRRVGAVVANWLVTLRFPALSRTGVGLPGGLYAGASAGSVLLVARFVRETKGRALEDM